VKGRSLFDLIFRRSGFGVERRSLFGLRELAIRFWVLRGNRYIFMKFDDFAITKDAKFTKAA
jgi:hypothetical protein